MSSKPARGATTTRPNGNTTKKKNQLQQQQQAQGKKPAIPSQKRASHEKQQQQNGHKQPRELDTKVSQLTDKSELCREKIRSNLDEFSRKGDELKGDIERALERQVEVLQEQASVSQNVEQLRSRIVELAQVGEQQPDDCEATGKMAESQNSPRASTAGELKDLSLDDEVESGAREKQQGPPPPPRPEQLVEVDITPEVPHQAAATADADSLLIPSNCFEPLTARLDPKTKFLTLRASLERHFARAPELLEPICQRLLALSCRIDVLVQQNDHNQAEIAKLTLIKTKLGDLCRELQKSNNQIRIDSLDLIRGEQTKAREQAGKIQATLAGVMKLFDENQQRNLGLKQENVDLQTKLKALLDHCGQWEQCVETALKQRDIENSLVKTELKRLNLVRAEEQERHLKEKQDLLRMVELMRSHQSRVEDKEAKLREDLSSYASKYDECQEVIQKGLGKFQVESKRMLKQIEKGRQDYVALLNKYESSNKKIKELLEEKQSWVKTMGQANKKLEALERLCRSLKQENDKLTAEGPSVVATSND